MTLEFEFPDTGEGVTEGKFLEWLVEEGEQVEEDETVAEVETDKAVVDVPAPSDGTVRSLKVSSGDTVEVGEVIMEMETGDSTGTEEKQKEEEISGEDEETDTEDEVEIEPEEKDTEETEGSEKDTSEKSKGEVLALPKVRKLAEEKNVDLTSIKTGERITEEEVLEAAEGGTAEVEEEKQAPEQQEQETKEKEETETGTVETPEDVKATPSVRKLAREKGVDLSHVEGSGQDGKITRNDVQEAAEVGTPKRKETESQGTSSAGEKIELSGIRKTIAEKMAESDEKIPHVTHVEKADVEKLVELRQEEKNKVDAHLTYLPFIMKAAAIALEEFPKLNAELDEENDEIVLHDSYDFNIAVDTDRGLMVPLVENIDQKSVVDLAEEVGEKAGAAKHGDLSAEDMRNGTFSVTNIGVIGGEAFTPIIDHPQVAILGIGKIQETAEVVEGKVQARHTVKLSLSYDHRVVDGATAARFVNRIVENLEDPEKMLMEL